MATVKMVRSDPMGEGGPTTADVHPDEVEGMKAHGWSEAPAEAEKPRRGRPRKGEVTDDGGDD